MKNKIHMSLKEYRCKNCKKLLFKGLIVKSVIEIKCKSCKEINFITQEI